MAINRWYTPFSDIPIWEIYGKSTNLWGFEHQHLGLSRWIMDRYCYGITNHSWGWYVGWKIWDYLSWDDKGWYDQQKLIWVCVCVWKCGIPPVFLPFEEEKCWSTIKFADTVVSTKFTLIILHQSGGFECLVLWNHHLCDKDLLTKTLTTNQPLEIISIFHTQISGSQRATLRKRFGHMFIGEGDSCSLGRKHEHRLQINFGWFPEKDFNDTFCCGYRYAAFEIQQHHFNIWNRKRIQNVLHHVASTNAANAVSKRCNSSTRQWCFWQRAARLETFHKAFSTSSKLNKQIQAFSSIMKYHDSNV